MRHRLYFLMPDVNSCRRSLDDMLLSRIEQRHVHFLTEKLPLPPDLPEANFLQKTDLIHGAKSGGMLGAFVGFLFGFILIMYFDLHSEVLVMLSSTIGGALFGAWAASMAAASLPSSCLKRFYTELEDGKILMIVDVPARRVNEIEKMLILRHPEMRFRGEESTVPIFP